MYSQYGEDDIFLPLLPSQGRVLEIGAWDAITFSNSRALIERGWDAVLIEPSPGPLSRLIREYSGNDRVKIIGAPVSCAEANGTLIEMRFTDDAVSGLANDTKHFGQWAESGGFYGRAWMPALTMSALFTQFGGGFEMASFDVEGASVDLFAEMCRIGPRPRIVVVEHDSRFVELAQFAERAKYRQIHLNGTNAILEWTGKREA